MSEQNQAAAIRKTGITEPTAYKWLKDEGFQKEYRKIRRETMQQVTSRLQQASVRAVETLEKVMTDEEAPASSRVQSARAILDNAYKGIELDDIQEQLDEIKKVIGDKH